MDTKLTISHWEKFCCMKSSIVVELLVLKCSNDQPIIISSHSPRKTSSRHIWGHWNSCLVSPRHLEQSCRLLRTQMRLGPDLLKELLRVHFSSVTCHAAFQSIQLFVMLRTNLLVQDSTKSGTVALKWLLCVHLMLIKKSNQVMATQQELLHTGISDSYFVNCSYYVKNRKCNLEMCCQCNYYPDKWGSNFFEHKPK